MTTGNDNGRSQGLMFRVQSLAALAVVVLSGPAFGEPATPADPVKSAYRAFTAARARDDLPAADAAATEALAASEARDGGGGVTAVLALNLAMVRIERNHAAEAIAPARRAVELVLAGAKGVDLLQSQIVLGEAEIIAHPQGDETRLLQVLNEADTRKDLDDVAYPAAVALAKAATAMEQLKVQAGAWRAAALHADGAGGEPALARGRALTEEAIALMGQKHWVAADKALVEAGGILVKLAPEADADTVTIGEKYYADAKALHAVAARNMKEGDPRLDFNEDRPELAGRPPRCEGNVRPNPLPDYPERPLRREEFGVVVVRIAIDKDGVGQSARVISTLVADDFRKAVESKRVKWIFTKDPKAEPGCRVETSDLLAVVNFILG